ncbi:MAG: chemotaxis protein CheA [Armatimonadota bacterium]|nr:chemotaxis protein CheA [Armatimonadota bacterium]
MSSDMTQYLAVFLDEVGEQIQKLEEGILALERDHHDREVLHSLFRAAHTIKGSSAAMGFERMSRLTHGMEEVLDRLRKGEASVTVEVVDLLLACLDALKAMKEEVIVHGQEITDPSELIARLERQGCRDVPASAGSLSTPPGRSDQAKGILLNEYERRILRQAALHGVEPYIVTVRVVPGCPMKGVRAFMVTRALEELGEVVGSRPSAEELEKEQFDETFSLIVLSHEDPDRLRNTVASILDIAAVDVAPWKEEVSQDEEGSPTSETRISQEPRGPSRAPEGAQRVNQTVRVDVERLDELMNLVGELVIDRIRLTRINKELAGRFNHDRLIDELMETSRHIGRITNELQAQIMKARMLPIDQLFSRFPRMVRDLARQAGKQVEFLMEGRETELDRTVIEQISDPLIHLLRNAVDHGIETPEERLKAGKPAKGVIRLRASHEENSIVIIVEDDGRGIDLDRVKAKALALGLVSEEQLERMSDQEITELVFLPGFSTAERTSDVSGRGVGMDIVRNNIQAIGGSVRIRTQRGTGTRVILKLPLTLAIMRALLVGVGEGTYALPLGSVQEIIRTRPEEVHFINQQAVILLRQEVLPILSLAGLLGLDGGQLPDGDLLCVVAISGDSKLGLVVDRLIGEQEVVIKSLGSYLGDVPGISGATILGDGRVGLILDVGRLIWMAADSRGRERRADRGIPHRTASLQPSEVVPYRVTEEPGEREEVGYAR